MLQEGTLVYSIFIFDKTIKQNLVSGRVKWENIRFLSACVIKIEHGVYVLL